MNTISFFITIIIIILLSGGCNGTEYLAVDAQNKAVLRQVLGLVPFMCKLV